MHNSNLLSMLHDSNAELENALNALTDARAYERKYLARELHDGLGQRLTSLSLFLKAAQKEKDTFQNVSFSCQNQKNF